MISVQCARCGLFLMEPGAILFGPPEADGRVAKQHLCRGCYEQVRPA